MENKKISFEEHEEFGKILKKLNKRLIENFNASYYRTKEKGRNSNEMKSLKYLTKLRDKLEEVFAKDYPKLFSTNIYYGGENE